MYDAGDAGPRGGVSRERAAAQGKAELIHQRGRIWENVANDGWIGSLGAWDYLVSAPLGCPGVHRIPAPVGE